MEWAAAAMAVISTFSSLYGGSAASKAAKKAGKEEARLESVVTQAKITDLFKEEEVLRGQTVAATAGAGVKVDRGSPLTILAEQAREFARERMTVAKAGATRATAAQTRGRNVGRAATYQGVSQAASSAATAFTLMPKFLGKQKGPG